MGRNAWIILFLIWALHLVLSARGFFPFLQEVCIPCLPGGQTPILASTGLSWGQLATTDPRLATYLASTLLDDGISGVGLAIFGMVVSYTSYRKAQKWAWYLSWLNPIGIIGAQLNIYILTGSNLTIELTLVFLVLCTTGLFSALSTILSQKVELLTSTENRLSKITLDFGEGSEFVR